MTGYPTTDNTDAAKAMLDTFASAGADSFDVTLTTRQGEKIRYQRHQTLKHLLHEVPARLEGATALEYNVIVRPVSRSNLFVQLDDLDRQGMERVKPAAFLGIETSPGNYQAWIALPAGDDDKDFAHRLRKGTGADDTASGATRIAGSLNFKDKYAPNFPRVTITHSSPGLTTSVARLEALGLVAPPEKASPPVHRVSTVRTGDRKWPSYERCVQGAPENRDKSGPDISRADFTWCMTALSWGHSIEDTAAHLMEESGKARENGERYALLTAQNAAAAVERRQRSRA